MPIASATTLGGIKVGNGLSIDADGSLNVTNAADVTKAYVDGSLALRDVSIARLNAYRQIQDTSIKRIDTSINNTTLGTTWFVQNSSLNMSKFKYVGGLLEPSIASGTGTLNDASFGSTFKWISGIVNVSDYVSKTYVDGSLSTRDTRIPSIKAITGGYAIVNSSSNYWTAFTTDTLAANSQYEINGMFVMTADSSTYAPWIRYTCNSATTAISYNFECPSTAFTRQYLCGNASTAEQQPTSVIATGAHQFHKLDLIVNTGANTDAISIKFKPRTAGGNCYMIPGSNIKTTKIL